ncbi:hypothetical protein DTL21_07970 [Bremerella cremea]|uniref:Uncharacterized protein n=1 Tax=Blastopirellula marina TaxID=124 RepID=A0A2S8FUP0_9BACT|nr:MULTISPECIES: hypothetical protein [Pirellulaceae]PQO35863.1 hypothetical protein C5Y83_07965 [Blastopirellula marina]RCS48540.1 hypothetical protein DTL21_07970 [Bremerella cremea]
MKQETPTTKFTDSKGRKWVASIDVPTVKELKAELGVDLLELLDGKADVLQKLIDNPVLFVDALYIICREQCEKVKVTDIDFGRGLVGEGIDNAASAFMVGLADFFPYGRRRIVLGVIEKLTESQARITNKTLEALKSDKLTQAMDKQVDQAMEKWFHEVDQLAAGGKSSTN